MARTAEDVRRSRPERVPPHNLEAEESVLGSMMLSGEAIAEVIEKLEPGEIYGVSRKREGDEIISIRTLVDESMAALEHIAQRDSRFAGIPTGFQDLDELLSGLQPGNLIVIAARPGVGKSSFVTNIARNVAVDANAPVAMFSLEMSRFEIGMRLLCGEARVPWDKVRSGRVATEEWTRIVEAAEVLHEAPLYIVDSGNVTIVDIRAKARRMKSGPRGLGLIIVDYLQLMYGHIRTENRQQEVAEISRSLKLLAKELDIPVIAVSQLNRNPETRADKRPQLSDLRESGSIEQDADIVLFIHRDDSDDRPEVKGKADIVVAKHRNGPTATIPLTYLPHITLFRNFARV